MTFDLDAARAQRKEAAGGQYFTFTFGGTEYAVEQSKEWPVEAVDALAAGRIVEGLSLVLGKAWDVIGKDLSVGDAEALIEAIAKYEGFPLAGNSLARASRATPPK